MIGKNNVFVVDKHLIHSHTSLVHKQAYYKNKKNKNVATSA